ncbi:hypothetical protein CVD19_09930 [Bacillus sp. T33-2]|nr:hypothetical protein CVD19_09930 [Bacillus sp. T33-2]
MSCNTYSEIRMLRDHYMNNGKLNHVELNKFHDHIMHQVVSLSVARISKKLGASPSLFSFFVMGSAGRFEQAVWSDQDHGIVYEDNGEDAQEYFLTLGKEISEGLSQAGYAFCDGGVMASNPLWCRSRTTWKQQLDDWVSETSWESIRHLLIFIDGRPIYGEGSYIDELKRLVYKSVRNENMLHRLLDNTMHVKKGVGFLGQLLVETHGKYTGSLNIKEKAVLPYVNAARLLALKGDILENSTLLRLKHLPEKIMAVRDRSLYEQQFLRLMEYRLSMGNHKDYDSGHYLAVDSLTKEQKDVLKEIIKNAAHLYQLARRQIEKDD